MRRRSFLPALAAPALSAAPPPPAWSSRWIFPPQADANAFGVYHFRRTLSLASVPSTLPIRVSADNRFHLFVNGQRVASGPSRSDRSHWRYSTLDLAPHLKPGNNTVAAVVWNDGPLAGLAQVTIRTGFLLDAPLRELSTSAQWKAFTSTAYTQIPTPNDVRSTGYFAISPTESFDAARHPWGWELPAFDDSSWPSAAEGPNAAPFGAQDAHSPWALVPDSLPPMEDSPQSFASIRSQTANYKLDQPWRIPANRTVRLLLDQGTLTNGYPVLEASGGKGARLTLRYAEALFDTSARPRAKFNRNEIAGKTLIGIADSIMLDGASRRRWSPLDWRTWRYIEVTIETAAEPLILAPPTSRFTGFPFAVQATLDSPDPMHARILSTGWRTARLCAVDTYMDCPYYERLQYAGDTRIQALVSLYMTGDARLMRNAISLLDHSRIPEGLTLSRAPSALPQLIPPFSLFWIGMLHDYFMYVPDPGFVRASLPGVHAVLDYYTSYLSASGSLEAMPFWNFVDWVAAWNRGVPPADPGTVCATIHLQLLHALLHAAQLEHSLGLPSRAKDYEQLATRLRSHIQAAFWNKGKQAFVEDQATATVSQHANALAILAGLIPAAEAKALIHRLDATPATVPCTIYFRYYWNLARRAAGLGDTYLSRLDVWRNQLDLGLTTWAETDDGNKRSDCHAWGASPNIEFFRTVLGVDSAAPGFAKVLIRPHLGPLEKLSGTVPHPKGLIRVSLDARAGTHSIELPPGVPGELHWQGKVTRL